MQEPTFTLDVKVYVLSVTYIIDDINTYGESCRNSVTQLIGTFSSYETAGSAQEDWMPPCGVGYCHFQIF